MAVRQHLIVGRKDSIYFRRHLGVYRAVLLLLIVIQEITINSYLPRCKYQFW